MTQYDKPKRWRPRFSEVTLACCYLGCWEATKTWGIPATMPEPRFFPPYSPCPFLIVERDAVLMNNMNVAEAGGYYFWFFGYVTKLPIQRET